MVGRHLRLRAVLGVRHCVVGVLPVELQKPQDAVERRADVVAHAGKERGLRGAGLLRPALRLARAVQRPRQDGNHAHKQRADAREDGHAVVLDELGELGLPVGIGIMRVRACRDVVGGADDALVHDAEQLRVALPHPAGKRDALRHLGGDKAPQIDLVAQRVKPGNGHDQARCLARLDGVDACMGVGVLRDGGLGIAHLQVDAVKQRAVVVRDVLQRVVKVAACVDGHKRGGGHHRRLDEPRLLGKPIVLVDGHGHVDAAVAQRVGEFLVRLERHGVHRDAVLLLQRADQGGKRALDLPVLPLVGERQQVVQIPDGDGVTVAGKPGALAAGQRRRAAVARGIAGLHLVVVTRVGASEHGHGGVDVVHQVLSRFGYGEVIVALAHGEHGHGVA